nr:MAG TPA: hypothetical protein [Caudoviricetes sp.]
MLIPENIKLDTMEIFFPRLARILAKATLLTILFMLRFLKVTFLTRS